MKKFALLILAAVIAVCAFAGCTQKGDNVPDGSYSYATADPEKPFNDGIVEYKTNTEVTYFDAFDTELTGKIADAKMTGAVKLLDCGFDDGDALIGGEAVTRSEEQAQVIDGVLYVPYNEKSGTHVGGSWTTWAPAVECITEDVVQAQLSFDAEFFSDGSGAWMSAMAGVFKSNVGTIADCPGDGLYIGFNPNTSSIAVYGADAEHWAWPGGNAVVKVDPELIKGKTHADIIAVPDTKEVYVYLKGELVLHITNEDGKMRVFDASGNKKYEGDNDPDALEGGYFSFFNHLGGFAMDNIEILSCTKGKKKTTTTIEAVPVGDNSLGFDITDKKDVISICYTMWFNAIHGNGTNVIEKAHNVAEYTEKYGFSTEYGFGTKGDQHNAMTAFHYWSKPAQGYYRSTDKNAHRNNMTLLYNAGVDFIILDYTYATSPGYNPGTSPWQTYIEGPLTALLDTIMEMRAEGKGTPYVVCWMGSSNMFGFMKERFLDVEKWKDCFVYWDGKPFIMDWSKDEGATYDGLTVRSMYGLRGKADVGQWSYLEIDNSKTVSYDAEGKPEHMCADVATQETYMSLPTAHGRQGGRFWNGQWKNVFAVHPKIVTVTWWNEWCAQLYYVDGVGYIFTDNFNQEYSRDVEPMEGGHGDLYYRWLCEYIRCYRNGSKCPDLTEK